VTWAWFDLGLVWFVGYLLACWLWPYARCLWCKDTPGKRRSPSGKAWGDCRHCEGSGKRLRVGRRIWDFTTNR
jgi:hypothetical protein